MLTPEALLGAQAGNANELRENHAHQAMILQSATIHYSADECDSSGGVLICHGQWSPGGRRSSGMTALEFERLPA